MAVAIGIVSAQAPRSGRWRRRRPRASASRRSSTASTRTPTARITLSFGYSNLNRDEIVEIPLGPNNFIEPKEYDGRQPTSFPPGSGERRRPPARVAIASAACSPITVPAGFKGDVVWTLRHARTDAQGAGRAKTGAYGLKWPMAMGSIPPLLRFTADGPTGRGPGGIESAPMQASVGTPLSLTIWIEGRQRARQDETVADQGARPGASGDERELVQALGPGPVTFDPPKSPIAELEGTATTLASFKQPGVYVLRVRADNFGRTDTSAGNQCCWTNGYVRVTVK